MPDSIHTYNFKPGFPFEIEIFDLGEAYARNKSQMVIPHRTNFYNIFLFQGCKANHMLDFKTYAIDYNSLLFVNKDRVHAFDQDGDYRGKCIIFTDGFFNKTEHDRRILNSSILFNDLHDKPHLRLDRNNDKVARFFQQIEDELNVQPDNYQYDILRNILHNLILFSERQKHDLGLAEIPAGADLEIVFDFKKRIDEQFQNQKQVGIYARQLNISEKKLNQATTKILGRNAKDLIDERVVLEAKRLLAHSCQSVKETGFDLGFDEPTNFIKYFRKHTQQTPVEFREKYVRKTSA